MQSVDIEIKNLEKLTKIMLYSKFNSAFGNAEKLAYINLLFQNFPEMTREPSLQGEGRGGEERFSVTL
jgi:hypothetical protein